MPVGTVEHKLGLFTAVHVVLCDKYIVHVDTMMMINLRYIVQPYCTYMLTRKERQEVQLVAEAG